MSAELDAFSAKYKPEMEELVEPYLSQKYKTLTVATTSLRPNDNPQGGQYIFIGEFVNDPKFGPQFKSSFYYEDVPSTEDGLKAFLINCPNIGEGRANKIITRFGLVGAIDILDNDINRLTEIGGLTPRRIPAIKAYWDSKKPERVLYEFLATNGVKENLGSIADKAIKKWGDKAVATIKQNPYCIVELQRIGFMIADVFAHAINKDLPVDFRVVACLDYLLQEAYSKNSNLCLPFIDLRDELVDKLLECDQKLGKTVDEKIYAEAVTRCIKANLEKFTVVKDLVDKIAYVYLKPVWSKEYLIGKSFHDRKEFNHAMKGVDEATLDMNLKTMMGAMVLDECQIEAIKSAFLHKITVITGPAGSGKSTITFYINKLAKRLGLTIRLMSPTGKAAQVLAEKTGMETSTIHRGLKMAKGDDTPKEFIREDLLLIDEISMCGLDTMYAIARALEGNAWANLVFVGDKNQLPSVSPGNFLSDIIESECANVVTLTKIHRQDEKSYIALLANEVSKGKAITIPADAKDINWKELDVETFDADVLGFIDKYLVSGQKIENLQVLSPMKKGTCGVFHLNEIIQAHMADINMSANSALLVAPFQKLFKGDRVIQTENNYDKNVFNGDMGVIIDLGEKILDASASDKAEKFVVVSFYGGETIEYFGKDEIEQLMLGFCLTIHKCQGSQWDSILLVLANEARVMQSKEILYTSFSRAAKQLEIIGDTRWIKEAPLKSALRKRYSNFVRLLEAFKGSQKVMEIFEKKE